MSKVKITQEQAEKEVNGWLDLKQVGAKKREDCKDSTEVLVNAIMSGHVSISDKGEITQQLKFATDGEQPVTQLVFKPRLKMSAIHAQLAGVKPGDAHGMVLAYVAALTGQVKGVIRDLDTEDYSVGQAIAIFFVSM